MFWLARLIRLPRPIPPTPMPAIFSMSLGGTNPRPSTCLGTNANAAPVVAAFVRNLRRDIFLFLLMSLSPCAAGIIAQPQCFVVTNLVPNGAHRECNFRRLGASHSTLGRVLCCRVVLQFVTTTSFGDCWGEYQRALLARHATYLFGIADSKVS